MDLSGLSLQELQKLNDQVEAQLGRLAKRERAAAIEQIYSIATSMGMPLAVLMNGPRGAASAAAPERVYRDPTNPAHVWKGRGPRPQWLKAALAAGVRLESLLD